MARKLEDTVVVITGASSGIGRATALAFAEKGNWVVLAARDEAALEEVAQDCEDRGGTAMVVPTDVRDEGQVQELARQAIEFYGRIDVWVNNAAVTLFGRFEETPSDVYRQVFETNLFGYIHGMRSVLPHFREQGHGTLINVASVVSNAPQPYTSAYVASKYAIKGLTDSLRMELALDDGHDIHLCTVKPASIDTPLFQHAANYTGRAVKALDPTYSAERVAKAIVGVAKRPRREVTVGGAGLAMKGFKRLAPKAYERKMAKQIDQDHLKDEPAEPSEGNLFNPMPEENRVSGGWQSNGRSKTKTAALAAAALAIPAALLWAAR